MIVMRAIDIVRHRRERMRQANSRGRRVSRAGATLTLLALLAISLAPLLIIAAGATGLLAFAADLPDAAALEQLPERFQPSTAATYLYAWDEPTADGSRPAVIIDTITDPRASGAGWVRVAGLPPHVVGAFLAALDPSFGQATVPSLSSELQAWWTSGFTPAIHSPLTAGLIRDHLREGASTDFTDYTDFAEANPSRFMAFISDRSMRDGTVGDGRRAWQDWFLARRINDRYSREQQLEWAINTAYFGHLAYGIDAAARVYFGKGAAELTPAEAALLAATALNPSANPFDDPDAARQGRASLLQAMVAAGTLSAEEAEAARAEAPALAAPPGSDAIAPGFARLARRELESILGPERLLAGGLRVETTLDLALQAQVECLLAADDDPADNTGGGPLCAAREFMPDATAAGQAVIAIDPTTGALQAIAGDTVSPHSTGTLAQPLIYLTALSQGYNAATLTLDVPAIYLQDGRPFSPRNADGDFLGPLRLRESMAAARVVPATQVLSWVGGAQVMATARALGLEPGTAAPDLTFPTTGFPASLLDLGRTFAAIGNGGRMAGFAPDEAPNGTLPRPATIRRIVAANGGEYYTYEPTTHEMLSPEPAYLLTDIWSDTEARCPAGGCSDWAALPGGQPAAVVTGQSADGSWALGYTSDTLIGVLAGDDAADIWRGLMAWSAEDKPIVAWSRPDGLRTVDVCAMSGLLPSRRAGCPTVREWFVPGTEPSGIDDMVRVVAVNRETGRLATIFTPPHLIERRTYIHYPPEAAAWAKDAGIESAPTEYDTIRHIPTRAGGAELAVEPWSVISGQWSVAGSAGGEGFSYFRLAWFPGLMPEAMQTLVERGESPAEAAELGVWDTTLVDDGLYTLLLTVVREDGTFDEVAVPVMIGNNRPPTDGR